MSKSTGSAPPLIDLAQKTCGVEDITLYAEQSGNHEHLLRTKRADLANTSNPCHDMDGLERHHFLTEKDLLVFQGSYDGPTDGLEAIEENLPLVRFGDTTNAGRQIGQHLRRLRFEPRKVILADQSSMMTSSVSAGQGFSMLNLQSKSGMVRYAL
jgi:DNA-binding transcriptional LysR family regulator